MILVDAGPLVALLHAGDAHHRRCVEALQSLRGPLATVWPVVTEAMYLLGFSWPAQDALFDLLSRSVPALLPLGAEDLDRMRDLMSKYRDLPMDLADAALVRVAERERCHTVFTLDRRDFSVYRPRGIGRLRVIP